MSNGQGSPQGEAAIPTFRQVLGHPGPLWMLFMSEFWERFAFYGIRWALVLYIVAQFHGGQASSQANANLTYGSYLALVYAWGIIGGWIADKLIGYYLLDTAPADLTATDGNTFTVGPHASNGWFQLTVNPA